MAMPLLRAAVWLIPIGIVTSIAGCDDRKVGVKCPLVNSVIDLTDVVCGTRAYCTPVTGDTVEEVQGASIGVDHCETDAGPAAFFGGWQVHGEQPSFEWKGPVRTGGVFPSVGYLATPVQCTPKDRCFPFPSSTVAVSLTGFDWATLQGDDVFIPFGGQATIERGFHATASLDAGADAAAARATIWAEGLHGAQTTDTAPGDTFGWGRYLASVVRIVQPQDGVLGPVGWVEVRLSEPTGDGGKRR
jgi:hypothetical protein